MFYGVDLHSDNIRVAVVDREETEPKVLRFALQSAQFTEFLARLTKDDYVVVEASTNTFWFYDQVATIVSRCDVINPYKFDQISRSMVKTDKQDAIKLVKALKYSVMTGESMHTVYVPVKEVRELRSLFTTYNLFKKQIVITKNRVHSLLKQNGLKLQRNTLDRAGMCDFITSLELPETVKIEIRLLYQSLKTDSENAKDVKTEILKAGRIFLREITLITGIKGISVFQAIALMADVVDIRRFANAKKFCSYLRTAPRVDSSNQTTRIGKINKQSRKLTLTLLVESSTHLKTCVKYGEFFEKKCNGKSAGKAKIAMIRKVLVAIYYMLMRNTPFYYIDKICYENKMHDYQEFLLKAA